MPILLDADAKQLFLEHWPSWTTSLWPGYWLRACPRIPSEEAKESTPKICTPGATGIRTIPDAMYLRFGATRIGEVTSAYVDAICIEVSGKLANVQDKRARYMPTTCSRVVLVGRDWLTNPIGKPAKPRWKLIDEHLGNGVEDSIFGSEPLDHGKREFPIRLLRVLYAIDEGENSRYTKWAANHVPTGYEYFCTQEVLKKGKPNSGKFGDFLRQMAHESQFFLP